MLASGIAVIGCSSDNIPDAPDKILDAGTTFYVRVAVSNADGASTRTDAGDNADSGNYIDGTSPENEIRKVLFVFYDADGKYVADKELDKSQTSVSDGNIEALVDIVVPVTLQTEAKAPAYVVAYVNPTPVADDNLAGNLSDIQANTRTLSQILPKKSAISDVDNANKEEGAAKDPDNPATDLGTNTNGFLMTNSVYYETNADSPVVGTPIPAGALYEDKVEAEKNTATKINIYVERVMAKIIVNKNLTDGGKPGDITDAGEDVVSADGQTSYTLDFVEKAWGLTNEEKLGFVLKNFRTGKVNKPITVTNMSYAEASTAMAALTSPDWNYKAQTDVNKGRRSFWAYSYNYFNEGTNYPEFADEYKGNETTYPLNQTEFIEIYDTKKETFGPKGHDFGTAGYALENTVSLNTLNNTKAGERAVVNALVVGKYIVKDKDGNAVSYDNLYIRRDIDNKNIIYVGDKFMKQSFLGTQVGDGVIYTMTIKTEGDKKSEVYNPVVWSDENDGDFEIVHPSKTVTGMYTASRYVTMLLKTGLTDLSTTTEEEGTTQTTYKYYYRNSNGIMTGVSNNNINDVRSAMYKYFNSKLGGVEMFYGGYAYFKVPIRHLWGRNNKGFGDSATATADGFSLGQYGVVRNHVYNINVKAIGGIGTGLSDPNDPIVIPIKEKEYFVATEIRAQRWRIVPTQDVILKP